MAAVLERAETGHGTGASPALVLALAASLLLHALLLQLLSAAHRAQPFQKPAPLALRVRIVTPTPAPPTPAVPVHPTIPPAATPLGAPKVARARVAARPYQRVRETQHRRVRERPAERRARTAKPRPPAHPRPLAEAVALAAPPRSAPPPRLSLEAPTEEFAPATPRAVAAARPAVPSAGAVRRAGAAADEREALAQYRRAVMAQAQRLGRYPRLALDNDWQGEARVHMVVGAEGKLAALAIGRGSGYAVLDRQALRMVRRAEPLAPIPRVLRGRQFTVEIPVIFRLREPS